MPQSLSQLYIHSIFSTKNRVRSIAYPQLRESLNAYAAGILNNMGCQVVLVGAVIDHMHVLFRLNRSCSVADAVGALKKRTSVWIKEQMPDTKDPFLMKFAWQTGYSAFSVSSSRVDDVRSYIARQDEHHRQHSFQDEYLEFLRKHGVAYDEKYVWD